MSEKFLNRQRQSVRLQQITQVTHNTTLFRFRLPTSDLEFGLPTGKHVKIYCKNPKGCIDGKWNNKDDPEANNEEIQRNYTPIQTGAGYFELLIKIYRRCEEYPDGGKMSQYMESLKEGDTVDIAGPFGLVEYKGKGLISNKGKQLGVKQLAMIAGGTGITPIYQVITAILNDSEDTTMISLLYCNSTEDDVLLKDELCTFAHLHPHRFHLWFTVSRPSSPDWQFSCGRVTKEMVLERLPPASSDTAVLLCGPPGLVNATCVPILSELTFPPTSIVIF